MMFHLPDSSKMDMEIQQVPWWNRRSRLERRFFVMTIALLCATVGLAIGLTGVLYKNMSDDGGGGGGGGGVDSNVVRYLQAFLDIVTTTGKKTK